MERRDRTIDDAFSITEVAPSTLSRQAQNCGDYQSALGMSRRPLALWPKV